MSGFQHEPVLWRETLELLALGPGLTAVDCTVGGGGHGSGILERILPGGRLVAIDRDPEALAAAALRLAETAAEARPRATGMASPGGTAAALPGGTAESPVWATAASGETTAAPSGAAANPSEAALPGWTAASPGAAETLPDRAAAAFGDGKEPYVLVHSNFSRILAILDSLGLAGLDRALMDLGVSSHQLDESGRGFSYHQTGPLDMRMDPAAGGPTARDVVNGYSASALEQILWRYGEERWSRRIAAFIVAERAKAPLETTDQLTAVIKKAIPAGARADGPHPARKTFMALRIFLNQEIENLAKSITDTVAALRPGGRLAVISFHSLEDRLVKDTFKTLAAGCICPKDLPVCACGIKSQGRILTPKPVLPRAAELAANPRARSAKLRGFEKY